MSKILRNQNSFDVGIDDVGVKVLAQTAYTIPPQDYLRFAGSSDTIRHLANADLVFNDGGNDLNLSDAVNVLKGWCHH